MMTYSIHSMLEKIRSYGFHNERVLKAMEEIDRKLFVPEEFQNEAYYDGPLQIGREATISQPATVAFMLDHLNVQPGHKVLEIGAGSGWVAALLGNLVGKHGSVYGLEIDAELAQEAQKRIHRLHLDHVVVLHYDGSWGYPSEAPYDRILISAACPPVPKTLFDQLKTPGILVAPVGVRDLSIMKVYAKTEQGIEETEHGAYRFVPLRHSTE